MRRTARWQLNHKLTHTSYEVPDQVRWQTSLPHLATERRAQDTTQWIREYVRPRRRYHPPGGSGLRRRMLRKVRKSTAQRYYQLLSGHAAIGSFLHDRITGPQRLETDECWWCNCGKRQSRYHLFTEFQAWLLQIRDLRRRIGKECHWEHPRGPALRWLWKQEATEAVIEFLEDTRIGCRVSSGRALVD